MDNQKFLLLVARKLSGEATEEDQKELSGFFEEDKAYKEKYDLLKAHWENKNDVRTDIDAALERIILRIEKDRGQSDEEAPVIRLAEERSGIRRYLSVLSKVAAILLICLGSIYFIYEKTKPDVSPEQAIAQNTDWQTKQTNKGARSTIFLQDGTKVILNADSKLRFPQNFSGATREIYLTGEAFFDVTHNASMPFIIHTDKMNIKVLGTEFNVKSYPEDSAYETTLIRGSIEVTLKDRPSDRIILKPKEKLIVANLAFESAPEAKTSLPSVHSQLSITGLHYVSKTDSAVAETSWVDNKLVFQDESFANLATDMQRKYAVSIYFSNEKIKEYRFTGIFKEETIRDALNALQLTEKFNYKIAGNEVYIFN
jgi:ferric-dicitrate binding protein FerR (iron transport regulator)